MLCNFLVWTLQYLKKNFDYENMKKLKVAYLIMAVWIFFSLQPRLPKTAQNVIASCIQ